MLGWLDYLPRLKPFCELQRSRFDFSTNILLFSLYFSIWHSYLNIFAGAKESFRCYLSVNGKKPGYLKKTCQILHVSTPVFFELEASFIVSHVLNHSIFMFMLIAYGRPFILYTLYKRAWSSSYDDYWLIWWSLTDLTIMIIWWLTICDCIQPVNDWLIVLRISFRDHWYDSVSRFWISDWWDIHISKEEERSWKIFLKFLQLGS